LASLKEKKKQAALHHALPTLKLAVAHPVQTSLPNTTAVADLAYSYVVTLKRTKANADTTEKTVTVEHSNRTPVAGNKFRLTIAPTSLAALIGDRAGRCACPSPRKDLVRRGLNH